MEAWAPAGQDAARPAEAQDSVGLVEDCLERERNARNLSKHGHPARSELLSAADVWAAEIGRLAAANLLSTADLGGGELSKPILARALCTLGKTQSELIRKPQRGHGHVLFPKQLVSY